MNDEATSVDQSLGAIGEHSVDRLAVLLELIPLTAIFLFFGVVVDADREVGLWVAVAPLMASGIGWLKIGRVGTGCALGVIRAIALWIVAAVAILAVVSAFGCSWEEVDADCDETGAVVIFGGSLIAFAALAFLTPIVSAIMVGLASRQRAGDVD